MKEQGIWSRIENGTLSAGRWIAQNDVIYELFSFLLVLGALYLGIMGGLMVLLLTDSPLRSVYSDSMNHHGLENYWRLDYERRGYSTSNFPLQGGFARGDLLLIRGVDPASLRVGDVIVYRGAGDRLIVHRICSLWKKENGEILLQTKGDANPYWDPPIRAEDVVGKVLFVVPKLGWLSIWWRSG
jgi:signal peptidase I